MVKIDQDVNEGVPPDVGAYMSLVDPSGLYTAGREREIGLILCILGKSQRHNVIITGPSGCGKSHLVREVSRQVGTFNERIPVSIANANVFKIDVCRLCRNTGLRGQLEERLAQMSLVAAEERGILWFDNVSGVLDGTQMSMADVVRPLVTGTDNRVIICCSIQVFKKSFETHPAIQELFQVVRLGEPSAPVTQDILRHEAEGLARYHRLRVNGEAVRAALTEGARSRSNRSMPGLGIDILDQACSAASATGSGEVARRHVIEAIAALRGTPVPDWQGETRRRLSALEEELGSLVVGQDEAVRMIAADIRRNLTGLRNPRRPAGVYLMAGSTGTGKTHTAKMLARCIYGSEDDLIRVDMAEFMDKIAVTRLIGSPPGYQDHERGGQLAEQVKQKPFSVVVFDEIEKAHPEVLNLLLHVLDEGYLHDSSGVRVDFSNTIVVMTSNIGQDRVNEARRRVGFSGGEDLERGEREEVYRTALRKALKPEFLGRIERLIVFNPHTDESLKRVIQMELDRVKGYAEQTGIKLVFDGAIAEKVLAKLDRIKGARAVRETVDTQVVHPLSDRLVNEQAAVVFVSWPGDVLEIRLGAGSTVSMPASACEASSRPE